jgi:cell division protease FtsH
VLARATPGFSGADLANLVNEAALFAARGSKQRVTMEEFEKAKDKIMMGAERKSMVMSDKEKLNTAYHEAGHAIVGRLVPEHDPVYKVSIIPRGRALGVTMFLPEEDRYSHSKQSILSQICSLYGGRIAEEMTLGTEGVTTGASNDIHRATQMAHNMVKKWGLSERLGPLQYDDEADEVYQGRSLVSQNGRVLSSDTTKAIDEEVRLIIDTCYARAKEILETNRDKLEAMKDALMEWETVDAGQIDDIMAGRKPRPPEGWHDDDYGSGNNISAKTEKPEGKDDKKESNKPIGGPAGEH